MQADKMDILGALRNLLQNVKETNKLNTKPLDQWPTYAAMLKKITLNEDGEAVYQGQALQRFSEAKGFSKLITKNTANVSLNASEHIYPGLIFSSFET